MARWKKLGIIAGGGALPVLIARASLGRGDPVHVIRMKGFADDELGEFPGADCGVAEAGKILRTLKREECDAVVFAGAVSRPDFRKLTPDWRGAAMLPKIIAAAARGDGPLLSVLIDAIESEGMFVVGADEVTTDLAAPKGAFGAVGPSAENFADIRKAAAVIRALGAFDIGQGAVVANGLVLAVEAAEGTDEMIARCAALPREVRGLNAEGGPERAGVIVKRPKPGQELRIDLPTIGAQTVMVAADAGLSGVAVEAGVALVIDIDAVRKTADELGLFVYGFDAAQLRSD